VAVVIAIASECLPVQAIDFQSLGTHGSHGRHLFARCCGATTFISPITRTYYASQKGRWLRRDGNEPNRDKVPIQACPSAPEKINLIILIIIAQCDAWELICGRIQNCPRIDLLGLTVKELISFSTDVDGQE